MPSPGVPTYRNARPILTPTGFNLNVRLGGRRYEIILSESKIFRSPKILSKFNYYRSVIVDRVNRGDTETNDYGAPVAPYGSISSPGTGSNDDEAMGSDDQDDDDDDDDDFRPHSLARRLEDKGMRTVVEWVIDLVFPYLEFAFLEDSDEERFPLARWLYNGFETVNVASNNEVLEVITTWHPQDICPFHQTSRWRQSLTRFNIYYPDEIIIERQDPVENLASSENPDPEYPHADLVNGDFETDVNFIETPFGAENELTAYMVIDNTASTTQASRVLPLRGIVLSGQRGQTNESTSSVLGILVDDVMGEGSIYGRENAYADPNKPKWIKQICASVMWLHRLGIRWGPSTEPMLDNNYDVWLRGFADCELGEPGTFALNELSWKEAKALCDVFGHLEDLAPEEIRVDDVQQMFTEAIQSQSLAES